MEKATAMFKTAGSVSRGLALTFLLAAAAVPARAGGGAVPTAVFPFEMEDAGLVGVQPADQARLHRLDVQLLQALTASGKYAPVDIENVASQLADNSLHDCTQCGPELARAVGARVSVNGWVQKVSNLILNINLVVRDAATGKVLRAGSVDIRGDTDESWKRGLAYLLRNRILNGQEASTR